MVFGVSREIAHIAINLAFHILIILNSFFPHFLSSWNVYEWCVHMLH